MRSSPSLITFYLLCLLVPACSIVNDSFVMPGGGAVSNAPKALLSVSVTPTSVTVPLGRPQTFRAFASYSDGSNLDVSSRSSWSAVEISGSAGLGNSGEVVTWGGSQGSVTIRAQYSGMNGEASLTVGPAALVSIGIAGPSSLALGTSQAYTATGTFTDGTQQDVTNQVGWSVVNGTGYAVVNPSTGLLNSSGGSEGLVTLYASEGTVSGNSAISIGAPTLSSISVTPATPSVPLGNGQQMTATGTYSDGSTQNITSSVTWTATAVTGSAGINSSGLASTSGGSLGTVTITAKSGAISGNTTLSVAAPVLVSMAVTPTNASVALGNTEAYTATGTYSDGSHQNLTGSVTWSAVNGTGSATINSAGLANTAGGAVGTVTIGALQGTIGSSTTLNVGAAQLVSINVTPTNPTVPLGASQQMTATGTYTDGSTQNITSSVTWTATPITGSATINNGGLASTAGGSQGSVTLTATSAGMISGSTTLTVGAVALTSIVVTPINQDTALGNTQQYTATGHYSDGTTNNITATVVWSVINGSGSATIGATGLLNTSGGTQGSITVKAVLGSVNGTTSATVGAVTLTSISVTPATASVALGNTQQFTATGTYSDLSTQDITSSVSWRATPVSGNASINSSGLASTSGGAQGTVTITATLSAINGTATLTVAAPALVSIAVTPSAPSVALGNTQQFTAMGTYTDGSNQNITGSVSWRATPVSGNASINSSGLASTSGGAQGTVTITATLSAINGTATLTVAAPALVSIAVTPSAPSVALGNTQQFTAMGTYTDGSNQNITGSVSWTATPVSGNASINSSGLASTSGGAQGTVTITATLSAINGTATLTVIAPALVSLAVTPTNPSVPLGDTEQFTATGTYTDGSNQNITSGVTWSKTNGTGSATIANSGLASTSGGSLGTVTITATSGVISGNTTLTVTTPVLASIAITPNNPNVALGLTEQFTATGTYTDGSTQNLTSSVTWGAVNVSGAATINSSGLATTVGGSQGTVTITAALGAINGNTTLTVTAPALVSIAVTPSNPSINLGGTEQFTATGTYSDGSNQNITSSASWSAASGTGAARINSLGAATGYTAGTASITASIGAIQGNATLTITSYTVNVFAGQFWPFIGIGSAATNAVLSNPDGLFVDSSGDIYFADSSNEIIRRIDGVTGDITNVAGNGTAGYSGNSGQATSAQLFLPTGIAVDTNGDIYIADQDNNVIRKVTAATGDISTFAGTGLSGDTGDGGAATSAELNWPVAVALDSSSNLYISDYRKVRKVTHATGIITTVAGNGTFGYNGDGILATSAEINYPEAIAIDSSGDVIFADSGNNRIREVSASTGYISTVAGNGTSGSSGDGGAATSAELESPDGVAIDGSGNIYIADTLNYRIRKVTAATGDISTVAGNGQIGFQGDGGPATLARLSAGYVTLDSSGNIYISDLQNQRIRMVSASTGDISTIGGFGSYFAGDGGAASSSIMYGPQGFVFDSSGNMYIADGGNNRIREISQATGIITTIAGSSNYGYSGDGGLATSAELWGPGSVALDSSGNMYIADTDNHRVRMVNATTQIMTTIAGTGTAGYNGDGILATGAELNFPSWVALDSSNNVYISDTNNCRIRKITVATGDISTVAGTTSCGYAGDGGPATSAKIVRPLGIALDSSANIYISDSSGYRIRFVNASTGNISTIAGNGVSGFTGDGGPGTSANINFPTGIAVDASGNVYFCDESNARIREISASTGYISTIAGNGTPGYSEAVSATSPIMYPYGVTVGSGGVIYFSAGNAIQSITP